MRASQRARYLIFDRLDERTLRCRPGVKWGASAPDVLPASIADMDFPVAEPILASVRDYLAQGDLGYPHWTDNASPLRAAFAQRMSARYGWFPAPEHVREFTDVTHAVRTALELSTQPGDGVAIHTPAFGPFPEMIRQLGLRMVPIPLFGTPDGWVFDADDFASRAAREGCRVLILVNPHNPTGRVFTRAELAALGEVAERHDLTVISDDLHADLTYAPHRHLPFASLDPALEARTVTMYSASKAYNLAGMRCAVGHVGPSTLREKLAAMPAGPNVNVLGMRASLAAWTEASDWLDTVVGYLDDNRRLIGSLLAERLPEVRYHPPEATYLAWLDCRALGCGDDPAGYFLERARVELAAGTKYNPGGDGFVRLNFGTTTPVLRAILDRMTDSVAVPRRLAS
ncbi:aminotransferase class I/II-fold pyridoxal phosphate-dependent enzyme [Amycolatopsis sp. DG1A-15b]|uniref:MalY/PatB family protein n=1 Tax=Amycolatopsis sp. DG1A-15b TaxID=3052846 RepID=UPI00255B82F5|nr:aminotransferase class I/II-fold pyridoxal phosphate-dependent enzyme [Amycolatopsis sp. DG1A-15b]WIX92172.1 aminotransferase class I/II-fold pyridoxal phosphate-dependent enzyme [Amycolatopsis sp. DG1A-15b]